MDRKNNQKIRKLKILKYIYISAFYIYYWYTGTRNVYAMCTVPVFSIFYFSFSHPFLIFFSSTLFLKKFLKVK